MESTGETERVKLSRTTRRGEDERHIGIISNSMWGLERNSQIWHHNVISFWLNVTFFSAQFLWDLLQVHTSPDMFARVASINCLRVPDYFLSDVHSCCRTSLFYEFSTSEAGKKKPSMSFSGWVASTNATLASCEATVPCNIDTVQKRAQSLEAADASNLLSRLCLHLSCSSDLDLDCDSYQEDCYDRYCQRAAPLAHVCLCALKEVDSSSPLPPSPSRVCCLLSASQLSGAEEWGDQSRCECNIFV